MLWFNCRKQKTSEKTFTSRSNNNKLDKFTGPTFLPTNLHSSVHMWHTAAQTLWVVHSHSVYHVISASQAGHGGEGLRSQKQSRPQGGRSTECELDEKVRHFPHCCFMVQFFEIANLIYYCINCINNNKNLKECTTGPIPYVQIDCTHSSVHMHQRWTCEYILLSLLAAHQKWGREAEGEEDEVAPGASGPKSERDENVRPLSALPSLLRMRTKGRSRVVRAPF